MGSKENSKGYTPLMYACCYGHEDIVKLLIDMKVPIQYQSKKCHGRTALMVAANLDNLTILNMVCKVSPKHMFPSDFETSYLCEFKKT